jgi:hypothetical protein
MGIPTGFEGLDEGAKCTRFNRSAQTGHEVVKIVQIVFRHEHRPEHFTAAFEVVEVGA